MKRLEILEKKVGDSKYEETSSSASGAQNYQHDSGGKYRSSRSLTKLPRLVQPDPGEQQTNANQVVGQAVNTAMPLVIDVVPYQDKSIVLPPVVDTGQVEGAAAPRSSSDDIERYYVSTCTVGTTRARFVTELCWCACILLLLIYHTAAAASIPYVYAYYTICICILLNI